MFGHGWPLPLQHPVCGRTMISDAISTHRPGPSHWAKHRLMKWHHPSIPVNHFGPFPSGYYSPFLRYIPIQYYTILYSCNILQCFCCLVLCSFSFQHGHTGEHSDRLWHQFLYNDWRCERCCQHGTWGIIISPTISHVALPCWCTLWQSNMVAMDTVDDFLIYMPMYGGFLLAMFDCRRMYCTSVYVPMSSTLGQTIFTRAEAQVDQEVATQIKQVEATKWIVTAVLKLVQKWGKTFFCGKLNGNNYPNFLKLSSIFLGFPWRVERLTNGDVSQERLGYTQYWDRRSKIHGDVNTVNHGYVHTAGERASSIFPARTDHPNTSTHTHPLVNQSGTGISSTLTPRFLDGFPSVFGGTPPKVILFFEVEFLMSFPVLISWFSSHFQLQEKLSVDKASRMTEAKERLDQVRRAARKEAHHWWLQDVSRQKHHLQSDLGSWSIWSPNIPKYPQMTHSYILQGIEANIDPYWNHVNHGLVTTRWGMCCFWWISSGGARAADQRCSSAQPSLI